MTGKDAERPSAGIRRRRSPSRRAVELVFGGTVIWLLLAATGLLLVRVPSLGRLRARDAVISEWAAARRTPRLDQLTHLGSSLSDTPAAIAVTALAVVVLLASRRAHDALIVLVAILGELLVFVLVTATVHRARPPVPQLDPAPPTSSFPSGHTGAAVALYVGLAILLLRDVRTGAGALRRALTVVGAVLLCLIPPIVAVSRIYRGMHYPSDVIAGALGGASWLAWTLLVLGTDTARSGRTGRPAGPDAAPADRRPRPAERSRG